jgi:hypothetical protein
MIEPKSADLLSMLEAAGRDERLATGQLYLDAKAEIERLRKALSLCELDYRRVCEALDKKRNLTGFVA